MYRSGIDVLNSDYKTYFIACLYPGLQTAYEAAVVELVLFLVLFSSEVSEGVDNDTKDEVLNDD